jgi:serine protease AprX
MIFRIAFVFVLVAILLNVPSLNWFDYAYSKGEDGQSKDSQNNKDGEKTSASAKKHKKGEDGQSKDSRRKGDSDKNKIFDDLEEELEAKGEEDRAGVIAVLKVPNEQLKDKVKELKKILGEFEETDTYSLISGFSGKLSKKQIKALAELDTTVQIEPDVEVHTLLNTATSWFGVQKARTDFSVDGNVDVSPSTYTNNDIVIAVIDTGIHRSHKDLDSGKIIGWKDYVKGRTSPYDDNGHGTHVASIAAGEGQANPAYTGVAPRAALVGVKVLNSAGSGSLSAVISGVNWVVDNRVTYGIEIMNLSLGTSGCSNGQDSLSLAINNAVNQGIVTVVAAGNSGPKSCTIGSPGAAENAITVGAMSDVGEKGFALASFSSRGPTSDGRTKPDVVAPGVSITAAKRGTTSSYITYSGTSMATPFVAGLAALILDANPTLTPTQVKALIQSTALDWGSAGSDIDYGSGRVDGYEAVRNAFAIPPLGTNIVVPNHSFMLDSLEGTDVVDSYSINVVDATKPISITMIMPGWLSSSSPDFDIRLKNPSGTQFAASEGVTRQESISVSITLIGTYTLEVSSYAGSGSYFVDISAGSS